MPDRNLLLSMSLGWLTFSSLVAVMVAVPVIQGQDFEYIDPVYYLMLLGPAAGWAAHFRGRLWGAFLLCLPAVGLGLIVFASQILPATGL